MINQNMHSMLVSFKCPECKHSTSQTVRKIEINKKLGCSVCCNTMHISYQALIQKIDRLT